MHTTYSYPKYPSRRAPELDAAQLRHVPVLIAGAGPVGLAAAIDLALRGLPVLIVDDDDTVSTGSRAVCYAKRTLEVLDRFGCGEHVTSNGVSWNVGRTFLGDDEVYNFNLQPEPDHHRPGMVNLQQYHLEEELVRRAGQLESIDLRWKSRVIGVDETDDSVRVEIETPEGHYHVQADWLIVADGARSPIRRMRGLDVEGKVFMDRFLIADIVMKADFPAERRFWFDPPFHPGLSVLLHKQADSVWRIDWQLGWDADPEEEKKPERVVPRIRMMLGDDVDFELEWLSVYTFQCRRMGSFRHRRLLFVGDAAHQVSPFGARGANSGIQDVDNLGWKLALVVQGKAPASLLDSYDAERVKAADENIMNSTRSTDFITPKSSVSRTFRNATLLLARDFPFARALVNSGRLSVPTYYLDSPLNTPDQSEFSTRMRPGAPLDDAPVLVDGKPAWLLEQTGEGFQALLFAESAEQLSRQQQQAVRRLASEPVPISVLLVTRTASAGIASPQAAEIAPNTSAAHDVRVLHDPDGRAWRRFDARPGTTYLLRPDQHVCARFRDFDADALMRAQRRALAMKTTEGASQ